MVDIIKRVFSHATVVTGFDFIAAFYSGGEWITQEFEVADFLRLFSLSSGVSLIATPGRTGIKFFTQDDAQNLVGISPPSEPPPRMLKPQIDPPTGELKPPSEEEYKAVMDFLFPNKEIVGIPTLAKFKKLKDIIAKMQTLGFYAEYDVFVPDEHISDGGIALYIDSETSRFPKVLRGDLLALFARIFEVSDCVWIETKPDEGYLTIHCVVK